MKGPWKPVRTETLRADFKECWKKGDYPAVLQMAKRVPEPVIHQTPTLLMDFDDASIRMRVRGGRSEAVRCSLRIPSLQQEKGGAWSRAAPLGRGAGAKV